MAKSVKPKKRYLILVSDSYYRLAESENDLKQELEDIMAEECIDDPKQFAEEDLEVYDITGLKKMDIILKVGVHEVTHGK